MDTFVINLYCYKKVIASHEIHEVSVIRNVKYLVFGPQLSHHKNHNQIHIFTTYFERLIHHTHQIMYLREKLHMLNIATN